MSRVSGSDPELVTILFPNVSSKKYKYIFTFIFFDITDFRGQGYDNACNMTGKYKGLQAHILQVSKYAKFVPCAAHSLNLVGLQAAEISVDGKKIGKFQNIFVFFLIR